MKTNWWGKPRNISVVVDNESWILPYARKLVEALRGDKAVLCRTHNDILEDGVAFYLGCVKIAPSEIIKRNHRNLVVHESDLPKGKGFAPMTWQILEGKSEIPICLIEAADEIDSGAIIYRDAIHLKGHELCPEWHALQGEKTVELCLRFLKEKMPPVGAPQKSQGSVYPRRRPQDSALDPNKTIAEQFDLLRVVNNEDYPAFFEYGGLKYILKIEKDKR